MLGTRLTLLPEALTPTDNCQWTWVTRTARCQEASFISMEYIGKRLTRHCKAMAHIVARRRFRYQILCHVVRHVTYTTGVLTTSEYHYDEISTHYANIPHITCLSLLRLAHRWSGGAWGADQSHLRGGYHINWSQGYVFSKEGKRDIACYETPYSSRDIHKENLLTDPGSFQDGPISSPGSPRYPMERYQRRCLP